jgi:hypothetical protein
MIEFDPHIVATMVLVILAIVGMVLVLAEDARRRERDEK